MKHLTLVAAVLLIHAVGLQPVPARAESPGEAEAKENWVFPRSMKVVDVKEAFGAVGDGKHDDTAALRKAFDRRASFVYLPNGTYLVREQIQYTSGPGNGPTIQGQSRDGVVIKLADDAKGFDNPSKPRAVVRLIRDGKVSADYFKIRIRNVTIDTGTHRGATGLMFYANNNGMCRNVRIVGHGAAGLDLSYMLNGPLLVSNVEIEGFDVGIQAGSGPYNSQTLEHVTLKGQAKWGVHNDGEALFIRGLSSTNACPAVFARGNTVLVDSQLAGGAKDAPAVVCAGQLFARNVRTDGYGVAIRQHEYDRKKGLGKPTGQPVPGGHVPEWTSVAPVSVGGGEGKSLNLPVEDAPYEPLPTDSGEWVCVDDFGADGTDKNDDTEAFRKAIRHAMDRGKSVLCFASDARYIVSGELRIGGSIRRLQGAASYVQPARGKKLRLIIEDGKPEVVLIDLLDRPLGRHSVTVENASSRTVVIRNLRAVLVGSGPGRTFCEDSAGSVFLRNDKHRCWVRQLNSESGSETNNENDGGTLWVLGLKTERDQTLIATSGGGRTEVLGAWVYQTLRNAPTKPMFTVVDSQGSFAGVSQWHWRGATYPVLVEETRSGAARKLTKESNNGRASFPLAVAR